MANERKKKTEGQLPAKKKKRINFARIVFLTVVGMITVGLVGSSFMFLF